jgi:hypothetical protein
MQRALASASTVTLAAVLAGTGVAQATAGWVRDAVAMLPDSTAVAACVAVKVEELGKLLLGAMTPGLRDQVEQAVARLELQVDTAGLLQQVAAQLEDRVVIVVRAGAQDPQIPADCSLPMPQIACMFFRRGGGGGPIERLVDALRRHASAFGFDPVYHLRSDVGVISEFCQPALVATGELAMSVGPPLFLVSNSGPLVKDLLRGAHGGGAILAGADPDSWRDPEPGRGLLWFAPAKVGELLAPWQPLARGNAEPDPAWMRAQRTFAERRVLGSGFAGVNKVEDLGAESRAEFDKQVAAALRRQWQDAVPAATKVDRAILHPMQALLDKREKQEKPRAGAGRIEFAVADLRTLLERLLGP